LPTREKGTRVGGTGLNSAAKRKNKETFTGRLDMQRRFGRDNVGGGQKRKDEKKTSVSTFGGEKKGV